MSEDAGRPRASEDEREEHASEIAKRQPAREDATREDATREDAGGRRVRWMVALGVLVLRALALTWRLEVRRGEHRERLVRAGVAFIYALPHGHLLPLLWYHRAQGVAIVISEHRDGEIIARVAERLGYRTVRGSTTRGAARALLGVIHELEEGHPVAFTPDGPRGPAGSFAPGTVVASQRSGCPILPVAAGASRSWRLRSWDRFMIPKPFARVAVAYGEPSVVSSASAREAVDEVPRFQRLLAETMDVAGG